MKASRIISWLFSLAQVIFILKLIEYARATQVDGISNGTQVSFTKLALNPEERQDKMLEFVAGQRRKKTRTRIPVRESDILPPNLRPKPSKKTSDTVAEAQKRQGEAATGPINQDKDHLKEVSVKKESTLGSKQGNNEDQTNPGEVLTKTTKDPKCKSGRAECEVCASEDCDTGLGSWAVPVAQLTLGAAVIAIWLILWFKIWKYPLVKPEKETSTSGYPAAVGGYGYGGHSSGGYSAPLLSQNQQDDSMFSAGGVMDNVMKAIEKFSKF